MSKTCSSPERPPGSAGAAEETVQDLLAGVAEFGMPRARATALSAC